MGSDLRQPSQKRTKCIRNSGLEGPPCLHLTAPGQGSLLRGKGYAGEFVASGTHTSVSLFGKCREYSPLCRFLCDCRTPGRWGGILNSCLAHRLCTRALRTGCLTTVTIQKPVPMQASPDSAVGPGRASPARGGRGLQFPGGPISHPGHPKCPCFSFRSQRLCEKPWGRN